jgi:hypothetical protein
MDSAVAIVQAYLHANGYFTVTEYPVIEVMEEGQYRTATDVDVMAVRLPGAGRLVTRTERGGEDFLLGKPDPQLKPPDDRIDLLICEVKQGRAELNLGATNPDVLRAVLTRFGGDTGRNMKKLVSELMRKGEAVCASGPHVRLVAFGASQPKKRTSKYLVITLQHVLDYLAESYRAQWPVLRQVQFKHPGFDFLMMVEKARRAAEAESGPGK